MKTLSPEMEQATQSLGHALKTARPLATYHEAAAALEADKQATDLLDELQQVQADIRLRQDDGKVTAENTARLRKLQSDVQVHPTIAALVAADEDAKSYLRQVNQIISNLIGIDFASLGRTKGCC